ncbi:MAG: D-alanyl-D-alanine carboxypeptidase/D-alanyl-D-alanine-endopeptidase [Bacteroidia bacterium]|nr:D-alanyl-D-alanine carboxypeptidase/D-alanyl-D-alanine-endopeptidase [Bacteroidia bacterium]
MLKNLIILVLIPLFQFGQMNKVLEDWKKDMDLASAGLGFCVLDAKTKTVLLEQNSQLALIPASTLKVLTTYAALSKLGQHYRFETRLFYTGTLDAASGVLDGDILILGGGDPSLQSELYNKDNTLVTDKWAKLIKEKGIKEIKGKVIGDASYFDRNLPGEWIWADISNYYGAMPNGLSFMDNKFKIVYQTGTKDTEAKLISYSPKYNTKTIDISSEVVADGTSDQAVVYGDPFAFNKLVRGTLPPNKKQYEIEAALPDPALLCAEYLCKSLASFGVKCRMEQAVSRYTYVETGENRQFLFSHFSPDLDNLVIQTNLKSNNLFCESLLRALGKGDAKKGLDAVMEYWSQRGIELSSLNMKDGSGLARANTCSSALLANALAKIHNDTENYKIFLSSLPVAGKSGSMSNIGKGKWIENNLRAKTGYMERVRAYTGYVKTKSGKDLCFAILVNNYTCSPAAMKEKIERFFLALESF